MTFETTGMIRIDKLGCRLEEQVFSSCMNPPNYEKLRRGLHEFIYHENNCLRNIGEGRIFTSALRK
ncbi:MAG TPA: hypothetical protein VFR94_21920 [Nitrososphaeraceae archaeon]|nr:hypothetical protein [Nitrososphaeraceae archaeon]